jgi:hypothetical protein
MRHEFTASQNGRAIASFGYPDVDVTELSIVQEWS